MKFNSISVCVKQRRPWTDAGSPDCSQIFFSKNFIEQPNKLLSKILDSVFIIARKRSLGQGNIFMGVCQEFYSQGAGSASVHAGIPHTPPGAKHAGRYGQRAGGTHPTGMQSCFHSNYRFMDALSNCMFDT